MQSLIENFGIDWMALLSQVVNFVLIFGVITFLIYKPLSKSISERRKKIKEGLDKEEEATRRLSEVNILEKETLKKAEEEATGILTSVKERARAEEARMLKETEEKNRAIKLKADQEILEMKERSIKEAEKEIASLAKEVLVKVVKVNPSAIDEALLKSVSEKVAE